MTVIMIVVNCPSLCQALCPNEFISVMVWNLSTVFVSKDMKNKGLKSVRSNKMWEMGMKDV